MTHVDSLVRIGFARLPSVQSRALFESCGTLTDSAAFAASWNGPRHDGYRADGEHDRRRRHATFAVSRNGDIERRAHLPRYRSRDYDPVNGGVVRCFEPVEEDVGAGRTMTTVLRCCARLCDALAAPASRTC